MNKRKTESPLTDPLRQAVVESGLPLLRLAKESGVARGSLIRFACGESSLRLDCADKLAVYFGLELKPVHTQKSEVKGIRTFFNRKGAGT